MAVCLGPVFLFVTASNSSVEQTQINAAFFFGIGLDGALQRKQEIKNNRKKYGQKQILKRSQEVNLLGQKTDIHTHPNTALT